MRTIELIPDAIAAADRAAAGAQPVFMLNLLRYRERADYGDRPGLAACSGRDAYHQRYIPAFVALATPGIQVFWVGTALAHLVAPPDERWHEIAIVQYPSFAVFRQLVDGPGYASEAAHHRLAALEDWRLIAMSPLVLG